MYGDTQVVGQPTTSTTPGFGITVRQLGALMAMQGMLANPHYAPFTSQELAQKAKEATDVLLQLL